MIILNGKEINSLISTELKNEVENLFAKGKPSPKIAIIQVGDDPASNVYINKKIEFANKIGSEIELNKLSEKITTEEIIDIIKKLNNDTSVHGIIIQLPIFKKLDCQKILNSVLPEKDVDGLGLGKKFFMPATTRGILTLLEKNNIEIFGQKVVIINDSDLVGKPTAKVLVDRGADVSICNEKTKNIKEITRTAKIIITAIGQPEIIDDSYLSDDQVVVDVGISQTPNGVVGDLKRDLKTKLKAVSLVPGGVGPMTVASLFQNLFDAYQMQQK